MEKNNITAIVLKSVDKKDFDKMLTLLTVDGVVYATLKGVRKSGAKYKFASNLLVLGEFALVHGVVVHFEILEDMSCVVYDYDKFLVVSVVCEMSLIATKYSNHKEVFYLLLRFMKAIKDGKESVLDMFCEFSKNLLVMCGYSHFDKQDALELIYLFESEFEELKSKKAFLDCYKNK